MLCKSVNSQNKWTLPPAVKVFNCRMKFNFKWIFVGVEAVGHKYRVICGFVYQAMFSLGSALVGLIAFFVRDWRMLQLVISLPMFTLTLFHWFESFFKNRCLVLFSCYFIPIDSPEWALQVFFWVRDDWTEKFAENWRKLTVGRRSGSPNFVTSAFVCG